jgi:bifunctional DNase/RNase
MQKMLQAEIWTIAQTKDGSAVLLRPNHKDLIVPIFIGQLEIQSILIAREGLTLPRPLTHDLILNLLNSQKLELDRVEIHAVKDNAFHARLIIRGEDFSAKNPLVLDCRPSDAFGLAVRKKCPIFVSSEIVKETGIAIDLFVDTLENLNISPLEEKKQRLTQQLNAAVETEDYEQAAELRDILNGLEEESESAIP